MGKNGDHTGEKAHLEGEFKRLGDRIKALRISQGFTSSETFANARNLSRAQYAKYEQGRNLTYANLLKVIRALHISIPDFFGEGFD